MSFHDPSLSPYLLPEGNVHIAFSGGRTSAYMLHQIAETNGGIPDCVRVVFANTGREMNGTLDFVQEVSDRWAIPITWVKYSPVKPWYEVVSHNIAARDGEPFKAMILHKRFVPNGRKRICTEQLKVRAAKRMLVSQGWKSWVKALGIRADEPHRHDMPDQPREALWMPLVSANVRRDEVLRFWQRQPFDLAAGTVSNCRQCFQFHRVKLAAQMRAEPQDRFPDEMEETGFGTFIDGVPWAQFREKLLAQSDMFEEPERHPRHRSCGAYEDGECTA
ncbi:phosphoadenosine phosphosulfate reductase family protein [Sulfitobacter sp. 915]|uniref:phosphoadenosine phosphosulfate reductase domain-containing protein n=1 Tax=Sulfitobacter sp. 915 TaxID=3368558 RepID=UPI0037466D21